MVIFFIVFIFIIILFIIIGNVSNIIKNSQNLSELTFTLDRSFKSCKNIEVGDKIIFWKHLEHQKIVIDFLGKTSSAGPLGICRDSKTFLSLNDNFDYIGEILSIEKNKIIIKVISQNQIES